MILSALLLTLAHSPLPASTVAPVAYTQEVTDELTAALERAGDNRAQLEEALEKVSDDLRVGMKWLITHMPEEDLKALTAEFLLENVGLAYRAWREAPWHSSVDEALFFDTILPYANVNEKRDPWRPQYYEELKPVVAEAKSPGDAAAILNNEIFKRYSVKYSTKRKKADQSPMESMESGMASCTGLSIMLIDACRAVGVPARFVGTPLWSDGSGNHSWVEVWDDGWHFTGAAEPSGMELDRAWFLGRASGADRDDLKHAIYAVTWRKTPLTFPMVWRAGDPSYHAVNVTDRYTAAAIPVPEGCARIRFRAVDEETGERCAAKIEVNSLEGERLFEGISNDSRFDANDHLTAHLPAGQEVRVIATFDELEAFYEFAVERDEQLITLQLSEDDVPIQLNDQLPASGSTSLMVFGKLDQHLSDHGLDGLVEKYWASVPLTSEMAETMGDRLREVHAEETRAERAAELEARVLEIGQLKMPFWYKTFGRKPTDGRSLFISMHGGGGAPKRVNDQQYENQKRLYEPEEGIYLVPRAPTDTWNLWHQGHIDGFYDRLIEDLVVLEEVNPDRVYIMGYSAGGDGVFQLAPRFADRLAAAAMMAGHPNETQPDGLRNIGFTLHMGGKDSAYNRNEIGRQWKEKLAKLKEADPDGYEHRVEIHEDKGHWMDREDAVAVPWMAKFTRNLRPTRVVWLQDDVTHQRFYWLAVEQAKARQKVAVERRGQTIEILEAKGLPELIIRLDDLMLDLDREVIVKHGERELFHGLVPRTVGVMARTLAERGDPKGIFCSEVVVSLEK